jgi:hypothetical protein
VPGRAVSEPAKWFAHPKGGSRPGGERSMPGMPGVAFCPAA